MAIGDGQNSNKACPNCGTTLADFRRTMLFGCAECYTTFRAEILAAVRQLQGRTQHTGKVPTAEAGHKYALLIERDQLNEGLAHAILEGRYADVDKINRRLAEISRVLHPKEDLT